MPFLGDRGRRIRLQSIVPRKLTMKIHAQIKDIHIGHPVLQ